MITLIQWIVFAECLNMKGNAGTDREGPAGNQQLIRLRSLLINMDKSDPQNG